MCSRSCARPPRLGADDLRRRLAPRCCRQVSAVSRSQNDHTLHRQRRRDASRLARLKTTLMFQPAAGSRALVQGCPHPSQQSAATLGQVGQAGTAPGRPPLSSPKPYKRARSMQSRQQPRFPALVCAGNDSALQALRLGKAEPLRPAAEPSATVSFGRPRFASHGPRARPLLTRLRRAPGLDLALPHLGRSPGFGLLMPLIDRHIPPDLATHVARAGPSMRTTGQLGR